MNRLAIFCEIDDFCRIFEPQFNQQLLSDGTRQRIKPSRMSRSEVMTILVLFHRSGFRNLKKFYTELVSKYWRKDFPDLLSYNRFVELQRDCLILLGAFMQTRLGKCSGVSFIDSSKIAVCNNLRIKQNKVFEGRSKKRKNVNGLVLRVQSAFDRQ